LRQQQRLAQAEAQDRRDIDEDRGYLQGLQRTLDRVRAEHERRSTLTPEQRVADQRQARKSTPRQQKPAEPGYKMPQQPPPDLGRGRDSGPSL